VPRVLLVDDDIAEISAVKRVLARAGHQAVLATNASDALAALARSAPAAIVVASTCEGGEALRRFAEDGAARALPIVVLGETSSAPHGATQVARPVDPTQLADLLAAALRAAPAPVAVDAPPARAPPAAAPRRAATGSAAAPARSPSVARPGAAPGAALPESAARRAAAEALRARAEELRRGAVAAPAPAPRPPPPSDLTAAADAALAELEAPSTPAEAPALGLEHDPGLEAILRRAEEAERAHAAERKARARQTDRATVEARQRAEAEQIAVEKGARARAAEERARTEGRARADAEARAQVEAEARARAEADRSAAEEETARLAQEELRRIEEERRRAQEEARRAKEARERARVERDARKDVEGELERLRRQLDAERRAADERAQAEERAAEERRRQEEETRRRAEAEEEALRAAIASARDEMETLRERSGAEEEQLRAAITSARAEMEALRTRSDDEARRRADAEAEIARLARDAERKAAEAAALPPPLELPVYRPPPEDPAPDPAQETARRRVAALRERPAARAEPAPPPAAPDPDPEPPRTTVRPPPAELRSGTLADLPAPRLLALAARAEVCGRLDFEGAATRSLFLEEGRIVGVTSSAPAERIDELALRLGLVTREQHRLVAAAAAPLAARRAAVVLLERGFLKPSELAGLVRRRTEEVVFGVFAEHGARFRWAAAEVPADESTTLERTTLQLAVEGVRRRWLGPEVDAVLGGEATLLVPIATGPSAAALGLSPEERRVVALADGLRTLDEVLAASPLDALSTRQVLAALILVGALAVRTFQGGRPAAAATAAIDLARVRDKLEQVRRADYFDVLGVGRLCTPHEVREAFERLRAELDPRRFQGVREDGLEGRLEEIQRVLADARDVLADDRLRDEYLRGLGD